MKKANSEKITFNYTWVITGISALMVCIVLGFCSSARGLFTKAITDACGMSRSVFSLSDTARYVTTALVNLLFGTMIAKFGAKKLIGAGIISLMVSCLIYSVSKSAYMFYLAGMFLGIGLSWTTTTMVGYVVNIWNKESKGTIMGVILASNGVGAAIATYVLSPVIHKSVFGYCDAYRLTVFILLGIFIVMMLFFKNSPDKESVSDKTEANAKTGSGNWVGIEYKDATKKAYFYAALVCIFFTGMMLQGITGNAIPHMYDMGIDEEYVATVMIINSLLLTVFKFLAGVMYDKLGLRITSNICMVSCAVAFLLLANVAETSGGRVIAMMYGIISTVALPLVTIMLPLYASDLFGEKSYSKMLGLFVSVNTAGYALGSPVLNLCYDLTGSYTIALYGSLALVIVVIICMNMVISAANKERKNIINKEEKLSL